MYGMEIRDRLVRFVNEEGMSRRQAAARLDVAPSTAVKILKRHEETGSAEAGRRAPRRALLSGCEGAVHALVDERPDSTLAELETRIFERTGVAVKKSSVATFLAKLGYTRKKSIWSRTK